MHTNDDDSWEMAAQVALDIHRKTISAVRERVRTGTGMQRKMRPRTATSRSRSDTRTRPVSAPSERVRGRPCSASSKNRPLVLAPSLAAVSSAAVNGISRAELEAWATLSPTRRRTCESRPTAVSLDKAYPKSAVEHRSCHFYRESSTRGHGRTTTAAVPVSRIDTHHYSLEQFGSCYGPAPVDAATPGKADGAALLYQRAARATPLPSDGKYSKGFCGTAEGAHSRGSFHDGPGYDGCGRQMLVRDQHLGRGEHDAGHQTEHQRDRSDISVRLLREHAKKAVKEEKAFLRSIRAEAKAKEDSEIEMIHRASQWSRDLDKDVLYLPHRVGRKLHVLKIDNGFAAARLDDDGGHGGLRSLEERGRLISVDFFLKGDYARMEKERYAAVGGDAGTKDGETHKSGKIKPKGKRNTSSRKLVRDRPDAVETCRELHQLIRDTVGLVEVLTRQAIELEGQGWNRPPGAGGAAGRVRTRT